jgi:hypothetical protein
MIDVCRIRHYFPKQNDYLSRWIQYSVCCRKTKTFLVMNPRQSPHPSRSARHQKQTYSPHHHCLIFHRNDTYKSDVAHTTTTFGITGTCHVGLKHHKNIPCRQILIATNQFTAVRYGSNDANIYHIGNESNESENKNPTEAEIRNIEIAKLEAIEMQKRRAIQFWNGSNYNEALKDSVHDTIIDHLNQGLVLPIFHALCRDPNKRLFSPKATVCVDRPDSGNIHLSSDCVQKGTAEKKVKRGKLSKSDDMSYIDAFFVDDITARSKVKDRAYT